MPGVEDDKPTFQSAFLSLLPDWLVAVSSSVTILVVLFSRLAFAWAAFTKPKGPSQLAPTEALALGNLFRE